MFLSNFLTKGGVLRIRIAALIAGALLVGLLAAGCGGDDDDGASAGAATTEAASDGDAGSTGGDADSDSTGGDADGDSAETKTIPKAEFVKRANAICRSTLEKITSEVFPVLEKSVDKSEDAKAAAEASLVPTVLVPGLQAEIDEIRALGVPSGDEEQVEAFLGAVQEIVDQGKADPESLGSSAVEPYAEAAALADKYGLISCPYG